MKSWLAKLATKAKKAPKKWKKSEHMGWTKKEVELEMGWRSLENPNKKIGKREFYSKGKK